MGLSLGQVTSVVSDWLPKKKELVNWIKTKTSSDEIKLGKKFAVKKSS